MTAALAGERVPDEADPRRGAVGAVCGSLVAGWPYVEHTTSQIDEHADLDVSHPVIMPAMPAALMRRTPRHTLEIGNDLQMRWRQISPLQEGQLQFRGKVAERGIANFIAFVGGFNCVDRELQPTLSQSIQQRCFKPLPAEFLLQSVTHLLNPSGNDVDHALFIENAQRQEPGRARRQHKRRKTYLQKGNMYRQEYAWRPELFHRLGPLVNIAALRWVIVRRLAGRPRAFQISILR
jgi:hypothetical protein